MKAPILTIIAGSNGSGKSTLTRTARWEFQQTPLLDPDAIAKSLQETLGREHSDLEAGRQVLRSAEELIAAKQTFTVETTLSGNTYLKMAERAKALGYIIMVVFVGTTSVELNIERVRFRVEQGGHDVPEEDQRRVIRARWLICNVCFVRSTLPSCLITLPTQATGWSGSVTPASCTGMSLCRPGPSLFAFER